MTITNPVERARALLNGGQGWIKGQMENYAGGYCLMGAFLHSIEDANECARALITVAGVVKEQYPDRLLESSLSWCADNLAIADFNDSASTEWEDVDRVLDKASVEWESRMVA